MQLVYGTIRGFSDETRIFEILKDNKVAYTSCIVTPFFF